MKKLFLFSVIIISAFFTINSVSANNFLVETKEQGLERLLEKIKTEASLSGSTKEACINLFKVQIKKGGTEGLTLKQKKQMNVCINAIYSQKFKIMEQKVEKLRNMIKELEKSGEKNIETLKYSLEQAEETLELLNASL